MPSKKAVLPPLPTPMDVELRRAALESLIQQAYATTDKALTCLEDPAPDLALLRPLLLQIKSALHALESGQTGALTLLRESLDTIYSEREARIRLQRNLDAIKALFYKSLNDSE